ncbi:hypothetical protein DFJ73DRAFT_631096 [Zopfochytrium polystomum]|nr:hypothetical protein DFJ73DRAFT_631096 [Zopfochytrium polystomum]
MEFHVRVTMAYGQQANGKVERANKLIVAAISKACEHNARQWHQHLEAALYATCCTTSKTTGMSLFQLVFGQDPVLPVEYFIETASTVRWQRTSTAKLPAKCIEMLDRSEELVELVRKRISTAHKRRAEQFDHNHHLRPQSEVIKEGDLVVVWGLKLDNMMGGKLDWRYFGQFWVTLGWVQLVLPR